MARTNEKTVSKFYDNDVVNGWNLKYEYESENGAKPSEVKVTGKKSNFDFYITKTATNTTVNFSGGAETDATLLNSINTEIAAINAEFEA